MNCVNCQSAVTCLAPAVNLTFEVNGKCVRSAAAHFLNSADAFHKRRNIAVGGVGAANAEFSLFVAAHGVYKWALLGRTDKNSEVFSAGHLGNQDIETADFRHRMGYAVIANSELAVVVVYED